MATKVKLKNTHDRMSLVATFDNGDVFKFNISRSRDSYSVEQLIATTPLSQDEFKSICGWCKCGDDETHMQRHARTEALCMKAKSLEGLAMLCQLESEHA